MLSTPWYTKWGIIGVPKYCRRSRNGHQRKNLQCQSLSLNHPKGEQTYHRRSTQPSYA